MPRPPTTGVVGSLMVQSFVLSRVKLWCAPVFATLRVAQAWVASPQAGGRQVSSEPGPGAGVAVGVGVGVGAGVGVGVGPAVGVGVGPAVGVGVGTGLGAATATLCSTVALRPRASVRVKRTNLVPTLAKVNASIGPVPRSPQGDGQPSSVHL